jgi:hypothetical protein
MSEETNKISRRTALGTIGTVLAATAVVGLASETAQAQAQQGINFVVDRYQIYIRWSSLSNNDSTIDLLAVFENGFRKVVTITFMKDGVAIPANTVAADFNSAKVYMPAKRFHEISEFLRHEKPVRILVATTGIATLMNDLYELPGDLDID